MPPPPRARTALKAMKSIGFSSKEAAPILRKLLEVYNNWEYIEDNDYKVLIDSILEAQEAKASTTKQNAVAGDDPEHSRKRIRKLSENPSISTLATDSSGEILLKKQKLEADVSPEEQLGGILADPVPLQVDYTGRIDVASSQFGNRQKMTEPTSVEPSFSSEKAEQDLSPVNRRETRASSCAQKTSSPHETAEHLMHGRDKMSASERSRNSIDLKEPKTDPVPVNGTDSVMIPGISSLPRSDGLAGPATGTDTLMTPGIPLASEDDGLAAKGTLTSGVAGASSLDSARVILFDAAETLIGCKAQIFIAVIKEKNNQSSFFQKFVLNIGKIYKFLGKLDENSKDERAQGKIIAKEIEIQEDIAINIDDDDVVLELPKKKINVENE